MRRFLLVGLVFVSVVSIPARGVALSCAAPKHTTPHDIVANRLDVYVQEPIRPADVLIVGTVIRVGDLVEDPRIAAFGYRLLTVVLAGAFGDRLEGPVVEIARRTWLDDGAPGGPVRNQVYLPLNVFEMGPIDEQGRSLYIHDMCAISGEVEDPYALASDLVPIAQGAGVEHQLFPSSALQEATMLPTTTTTTGSQMTTTIEATGGTADTGEVELPRQGRWLVLIIGGLVLVGFVLGAWRLGRSRVVGRD